MARDQATRVAVVGVGSTGFERGSVDSIATLASRALMAALDDAAMKRGQIDGIVVHIGSPRGLDYDSAARMLGLDVRFGAQSWAHGRFTGTVIQHAALALQQKLANVVLCLAVFKNTAHGPYGSPRFPDFPEALRDGGGPHGEVPSAGLLAPIGGAAMAARRYLEIYGIDREKLGVVPLAQRRAAVRNPLAALRTPVGAVDYRESPAIVEPLRLLDCSIPVDTAAAVLLTRGDRALEQRARPVYLLGFQGLRAGPDEFAFGLPGLGFNQASVFEFKPLGAGEPVFRTARIGPAEVDMLHCYDGFSIQVLWTLERFGFCAPGEAADWAQGGTIELDGKLPVNTSGGHLSEGHANGWGHLAEIVRQLRGDAEQRQVPGASTALWATTFGDAILYGNAATV